MPVKISNNTPNIHSLSHLTCTNYNWHNQNNSLFILYRICIAHFAHTICYNFIHALRACWTLRFCTNSFKFLIFLNQTNALLIQNVELMLFSVCQFNIAIWMQHQFSSFLSSPISKIQLTACSTHGVFNPFSTVALAPHFIIFIIIVLPFV